MLRPRDEALLWDSMGCHQVTGPGGGRYVAVQKFILKALSVQAMGTYESFKGPSGANGNQA